MGVVIGLINVDISFFTATIPTGLVYYFCMKYMPICEKFRKGTILDKKVIYNCSENQPSAEKTHSDRRICIAVKVMLTAWGEKPAGVIFAA